MKTSLCLSAAVCSPTSLADTFPLFLQAGCSRMLLAISSDRLSTPFSSASDSRYGCSHMLTSSSDRTFDTFLVGFRLATFNQDSSLSTARLRYSRRFFDVISSLFPCFYGFIRRLIFTPKPQTHTCLPASVDARHSAPIDRTPNRVIRRNLLAMPPCDGRCGFVPSAGLAESRGYFGSKQGPRRAGRCVVSDWSRSAAILEGMSLMVVVCCRVRADLEYGCLIFSFCMRKCKTLLS